VKRKVRGAYGIWIKINGSIRGLKGTGTRKGKFRGCEGNLLASCVYGKERVEKGTETRQTQRENINANICC
jgi:hypothetical protein